MAGNPVPAPRDADAIEALENRKRDLAARIRREIARSDPESTRNQVRQWVIFSVLIVAGVAVLLLAARHWRDAVAAGNLLSISGLIVWAALAFVSFRNLVASLRASLGRLLQDRPDRARTAVIMSGFWLLCLIFSFAFGYWTLGILDPNACAAAPNPCGRPGLLSAIYLSFITITTTGYGDVTPVGLSRVLAVLEAVSGYLLLGLLLASVQNLLSRAEPRSFVEDALVFASDEDLSAAETRELLRV